MNLVTACGSCNARKADRSPKKAKMPLVYLPYFKNHFCYALTESKARCLARTETVDIVRDRIAEAEQAGNRQTVS